MQRVVRRDVARKFARTWPAFARSSNLVLAAASSSAPAAPAAAAAAARPRLLLHTSVSQARPSPARRPRDLARHPQWISLNSRRWATSTTPHSTASDPAEVAAVDYLEQGTQKLEEGDVQSAKELYMRSVEIKRNASSLFNLGVTHYHLKEFDEAIAAWKESIELQPSSADAHTNLANAYIVSPIARPDLALHHLQIATSLAPEDAEIAFNMAAVLEACGRLDDALTHYKRSKQFGVDRAEMHIRNVSAKILGQRMKAAEEVAANKAEPGDS